MQFDSVTLQVSDGLKGSQDYAPNRTYTLTGTIQNATEQGIIEGVAILNRAGEKFLGRAPKEAIVTPAPSAPEKPGSKTRARKAGSPQVETPPADPSAIDDDAGHLEHSDVPPAGDPADLSDVLGETVKEITDAELTSATTRKNAELGEPPRVRALIATFRPADFEGATFMLANIPQSERQRYLDELAALKKA